MATLNVSLPDQLREWVTTQIQSGEYSSASDYLRHLIRSDLIRKDGELKQLSDHLQERMQAPDEAFVSVSAEDVKSRNRKHLTIWKTDKGSTEGVKNFLNSDENRKHPDGDIGRIDQTIQELRNDWDDE